MSPAIKEAEIEQLALNLLASLGWQTKNCAKEAFGDQGDFGREKDQPCLATHLRAALKKLNPELPQSALDQAYEELTRPRATMSLVKANQQVYALLKDGVKVEVPLEDGGSQPEVAKVIDWRNLENNTFFMARQFWIAGDMYNRRADIVGFVNGLPLVFIELKTVHRDAKAAFDDNFRDYKATVPHLFHANAVVILSNASAAPYD